MQLHFISIQQTSQCEWAQEVVPCNTHVSVLPASGTPWQQHQQLTPFLGTFVLTANLVILSWKGTREHKLSIKLNIELTMHGLFWSSSNEAKEIQPKSVHSKWDPWGAQNRWEVLTQRAMTLWDGRNSYTSSGNGTPWANSTPTKALQIHPVQCFYTEWDRSKVKLHQLIAQIWWISMGPQKAFLTISQCTHPTQGPPWSTERLWTAGAGWSWDAQRHSGNRSQLGSDFVPVVYNLFLHRNYWGVVHSWQPTQGQWGDTGEDENMTAVVQESHVRKRGTGTSPGIARDRLDSFPFQRLLATGLFFLKSYSLRI